MGIESFPPPQTEIIPRRQRHFICGIEQIRESVNLKVISKLSRFLKSAQLSNRAIPYIGKYIGKLYCIKQIYRLIYLAINDLYLFLNR